MLLVRDVRQKAGKHKKSFSRLEIYNPYVTKELVKRQSKNAEQTIKDYQALIGIKIIWVFVSNTEAWK